MKLHHTEPEILSQQLLPLRAAPFVDAERSCFVVSLYSVVIGAVHTEQVDVAVNMETCIREMLGSNLGLDTG
jgi:hypothetical protein